MIDGTQLNIIQYAPVNIHRRIMDELQFADVRPSKMRP